jgi:predicted amidohydrolase
MLYISIIFFYCFIIGYIVAAAQSGQHNSRRTSHGFSMIIDPWGTVISSLNDEKEGICYALMDKSKISSVRKNMPIQNHKRHDIYGHKSK